MDVEGGELFDFNITDYLPPQALTPLEVFEMTVHILICVLALLGNGLVIYVTTWVLKSSVNTAWFLGLAVADFTFALSLPFPTTSVALGYHWPFGLTLCKLTGFIPPLTLFATSFTVAAISLDRCVSVLRPIWAQDHRGPRLARIATILAWSLAAILAAPNFVYHHLMYHLNHHNNVHCSLNFHTANEWARLEEASTNDTNLHDLHYEIEASMLARWRGVAVSQLLLGFLLPFLVMITSYTLIVLRVRAHGRSNHSKPFKVMAAVVWAFVVCLLPLHLISLVVIVLPRGHHTQALGWALMLSRVLVFSHSCLNPILYLSIGAGSQDEERCFLTRALEAALVEETDSEQTVVWSETGAVLLGRETSDSV